MKQLPIYNSLKDHPQIVLLLGERIHEDVAAHNTATPYLVWTEITGEPNTSIDNITHEDDVLYQVMIYSTSQAEALSIRSAVAEVLKEHSFIDSRIGNYEPQTKLFARGFSGSWWVGR